VDKDGVFRGLETNLSASTLVWERGAIVIRMEGEFNKKQALELAASIG